jgi:hypothetical protein
MASSLIEIQGFASKLSDSVARVTKTVTPPKNLMGKQCICEMTFANWNPTDPLDAANVGAADLYLFEIDLNQVWSKKYTVDNEESIRPTLGIYQQSQFTSTGTSIVNIPDGPFVLSVTVRKFSSKNPTLAKTFSGTDRLMASLFLTPIE